MAEVQGYVYAAKRMAASCARRIGRYDQATKLEAEAAAFAEKFEAAFWCPEIGTYALALDGAKERCAVRASNAGQLLFTGIVDPERAKLVGRELLRPRLFLRMGYSHRRQRRGAL